MQAPGPARRAILAGVVLVGLLAMAGAVRWVATPGVPELGAAAGGQKASAVVQRGGFVMGSYVQITASGPQAAAGVDAALHEVRRLGALFDRFEPSSPVAQASRYAGTSAVEVPPEVAELARLASALAGQSGGAFDPTVAPLVDVWGFGDEYDHHPPQAPPDPARVERARALVDYRGLRLTRAADGSWRLGLDREGMALDLGAAAQGYAADRAIAVLQEHGVASALVDVGGEIRALGPRPGSDDGWRVAVRDPREPDRYVTTLSVRDGAVATSGDYERFFEYQGRRYSHLLDPRTGEPEQGIASVTVLHPSAAVADALATALAVLGPEAGLELLEQWQPARAMLVTTAGEVLWLDARPRIEP